MSLLLTERPYYRSIGVARETVLNLLWPAPGKGPVKGQLSKRRSCFEPVLTGLETPCPKRQFRGSSSP